ncbi:MAG: hypothetical protein R6U98_00085 [Pirellulaceae bacterium]
MRHLSMATWAGGLLVLVLTSGELLAQKTKSPVDSTKAGMGMMKDMPQAMKLKAKMMMKMEVKPTDPAALLAIGEQLELSDRQTEKLQQILADAREEAEKLLKSDQREKLEGAADLPVTHMGMHKMMMKKMRAKTKEKAGSSGKHGMMRKDKEGMMCPMMRKDKEGMMCPMMQAMQDQKGDSDTKAEMKKKMQKKMKKKHAGQGGHGHGGHH